MFDANLQHSWTDNTQFFWAMETQLQKTIALKVMKQAPWVGTCLPSLESLEHSLVETWSMYVVMKERQRINELFWRYLFWVAEGLALSSQTTKVLTLIDFSFSFLFFLTAAPAAHGGFQARGLIRAVAPGPRHSHSNAGSQPHLQPTPQLTATSDP